MKRNQPFKIASKDDSYEDEFGHEEYSADQFGYFNKKIKSSVEKAIFRGLKQRETKAQQTSVPKKSMHVIRVDYDINGPKKINNRAKNYTPKSAWCDTNPCSPRSNSPFTRMSSARPHVSVSKTLRPSTPDRMNARKARCSLRIAELAEPTKRQCIETWKSKHSSLPAFMLERLKQHVMNQKVIVNVPDAINCFRRKDKPTAPQKKANKGLCSRGPKSAKREEREMSDMRNMCAVFAHCMAKRLIKPLNTTLSDDLDRLSNAISNEIRGIFGNKLCPDYINNTNILTEMSGKVTIWIAGILNDAYYKLLEDDLRAKKRQENIQGKDGNLATLIEKHLLMHFEERKDLEEEEGPALDALDSLIDNVVNLCIPKSDSDDDNPDEKNYNRTLSPHSMQVEEDENYYDTSNPTIGKLKDSFDSAEHIPDDADQSRDSVEQSQNSSDHSLCSEDHNFNSAENIPNSAEPEHTLRQNELFTNDEQSEHLIDDDTAHIENALYEIPEHARNDINIVSPLGGIVDLESRLNSKEMEDAEAEMKDLLNTILMKQKFNVSGIDLVTTQSEEPFGEKKTVTFTDKKTGDGVKPSIPSGDETSTGTSTTTEKSDIIFAPPNNNLLCFADELWPSDLFSPVLKASHSVSKSITSLGKIAENEEFNYGSNPYDPNTKVIDYHIVDFTQINGQNTKNKQKEHNYYRSNDVTSVKSKDYQTGQCDQENKLVSNGDTTTSVISNGYQIGNYQKYENQNNLNKNFSLTNNYVKRSSKDKDPDSYNIDVASGKSFKTSQENQNKLIKGKRKSSKESAVNILKEVKVESKYSTILGNETPKLKDIKKEYITINVKQKTGNGDYNETDIERNPIMEAIKQKMKQSYSSKHKFDYKVHPQTAPSWAINSPSEDSLFENAQSRKKILGPCELRKWCHDLDHTLVNLDQWNQWIDVTCRKILSLKQLTEAENILASVNKNKELAAWSKLKKNVDKDAVLWRKLNQRTLKALKKYNTGCYCCRQGERSI